VNPAKWSVRRTDHYGACCQGYGNWIAYPRYAIDQHRSFPTWRAAFDFADQMARGLA
jgi:hypothetical protein